ncbi:hypothetical protein [Helicobacter pylori]|uniref:hypothetical protein n=1 Tax=Helicobacter pylori TaxID=210 RepID=UPI0013F480AA|nr:hypothetical protein [Helicobacter pylori]NHA55838.1 hypothetical protein [Helicobacter pylori]
MAESSYQKRKAESKVKDQIIERLERELNAKDLELDAANRANKFKDQIIESKDQTIKSQNQTIESKDQTIESKDQTIESKDQVIELQAKLIEPSTEEKYQDEEKEHSKSCLGLE